MKKLFAILSAFMLTMTSYAQDGNVGEFTVQPMASFTSTSPLNFSYELGAIGEMKKHASYGFSLGADLGYRVSTVFYPTVGLHFIQSRVKYDLDYKSSYYDGQITTNNIAIPILANFNISGLRLGVGIQPTINVGKSSNYLDAVAKTIKNTTIAIPVVLGYELSNGITFEYRFAYDVTKSVDYKSTGLIIDPIQAPIATLKTNNLTNMLTIGYKFKL